MSLTMDTLNLGFQSDLKLTPFTWDDSSPWSFDSTAFTAETLALDTVTFEPLQLPTIDPPHFAFSKPFEMLQADFQPLTVMPQTAFPQQASARDISEERLAFLPADLTTATFAEMSLPEVAAMAAADFSLSSAATIPEWTFNDIGKTGLGGDRPNSAGSLGASPQWGETVVDLTRRWPEAVLARMPASTAFAIEDTAIRSLLAGSPPEVNVAQSGGAAALRPVFKTYTYGQASEAGREAIRSVFGRDPSNGALEQYSFGDATTDPLTRNLQGYNGLVYRDPVTNEIGAVVFPDNAAETGAGMGLNRRQSIDLVGTQEVAQRFAYALDRPDSEVVGDTISLMQDSRYATYLIRFVTAGIYGPPDTIPPAYEATSRLTLSALGATARSYDVGSGDLPTRGVALLDAITGYIAPSGRMRLADINEDTIAAYAAGRLRQNGQAVNGRAFVRDLQNTFRQTYLDAADAIFNR